MMETKDSPKCIRFKCVFLLKPRFLGLEVNKIDSLVKESLDDGVTKLFAPLLFKSSANSTVAASKGKINLFFRLFAKVTVHRVMEMKVKETKQLYGRIYGRMVLYV